MDIGVGSSFILDCKLVMYLPNLTDFSPFSLEKLLRTCFSLPDNSTSCCVLIDLDDPSAVSGLEFLNTPGNAVQKRALTYFYEPLRGDVGEKLGLKNCDLFAFKKLVVATWILKIFYTALMVVKLLSPIIFAQITT